MSWLSSFWKPGEVGGGISAPQQLATDEIRKLLSPAGKDTQYQGMLDELTRASRMGQEAQRRQLARRGITRGTAGLKLQDNAGEGIHIKDGGDVTASKGLSVEGPLEITTLRHNIQKGNIYYNIGRPRVLNLATTDADLKGFYGGFTDGCYGYFVPYNNDAYFGKVARVLMRFGGNL